MKEGYITLVNLPDNKEAVVRDFTGGKNLETRFEALGILRGKKIKRISRQFFGGPVTVEIDGRETALGRGMAYKILVEYYPNKQK